MDQPKPGDLFQGFRIESELGRGGFATVFRVRRLADDGVYALKVLTPRDRSGYAADTEARFAREVAILATLQSPHTVRMWEHGVSDGGLLYMVFEYLEGRDLSDVLEARGRLTAEECVPILRQVLLSLQEAHDQGVLHRDIKPHNIRVIERQGGPPHVKLMDFGIARSDGPAHPSVTATGAIVGTPRYMSPEQLMARPISPASDLYSLGMVALEMVAGQQALTGNSVFEQIGRMKTGHLASVAQMSQADARLIAVIQHMTKKSVEARFASAREVLQALDEAISPETAAAEPATPAVPLSRRTLTIALACVMILLLAAIAALVRQWPSEPVVSEEPTSGEYSRIAAATRPQRAEPIERPSVLTPSPVAGDAGDAGVRDSPDLASDDPCDPRSRPARSGVFDAYVSHVPKTYRPGEPHPLVVLLHDSGHTPERFINKSGFRELADKENLLLIAPVADAYRWNSPEADLHELRGAVEAAKQMACVDPERVFLVADGKSGRTVLRASCDEDSLFAGIAANNFLPGELDIDEAYWCDQPLPMMWLTPTNGRKEPLDGRRSAFLCSTGSVDWASFQDAWRDRNKCSDRHDARAIEGGTCSVWSCETPFESCEITGRGGWPGTGQHGQLRCPETPPDVDIAPDVWDFFARVVSR